MFTHVAYLVLGEPSGFSHTIDHLLHAAAEPAVSGFSVRLGVRFVGPCVEDGLVFFTTDWSMVNPPLIQQ